MFAIVFWLKELNVFRLTEDISIHLLSTDEVRALLLNDEIRQALMAAPLWKLFAERKLL